MLSIHLVPIYFKSLYFCMTLNLSFFYIEEQLSYQWWDLCYMHLNNSPLLATHTVSLVSWKVSVQDWTGSGLMSPSCPVVMMSVCPTLPSCSWSLGGLHTRKGRGCSQGEEGKERESMTGGWGKRGIDWVEKVVGWQNRERRRDGLWVKRLEEGERKGVVKKRGTDEGRRVWPHLLWSLVSTYCNGIHSLSISVKFVDFINLKVQGQVFPTFKLRKKMISRSEYVLEL